LKDRIDFPDGNPDPGTGRWFDINGMKRPAGYEKEN
jgi:hypothetical protein